MKVCFKFALTAVSMAKDRTIAHGDKRRHLQERHRPMTTLMRDRP